MSVFEEIIFVSSYLLTYYELLTRHPVNERPRDKGEPWNSYGNAKTGPVIIVRVVKDTLFWDPLQLTLLLRQ